MADRYTRYPGESAVPGMGIPGMLIPGMDYLPDVPRSLSVLVFDTSMVRCGEIPLYESMTYTENWYSADTWELKANKYLPNVTTLTPLGYVGIIHPALLGSLPKICRIESFAPATGKSGKSEEVWTLSGRSAFGGKLKKRIAINGASTGTGYDTQTSVAYETAARHLVTENVISAKKPDGTADTGRNLAGITLETNDLLRGGTATELKTRGESIITLLETWSKASGLHFDLVWSGSGDNFTFTVSEGVDRTGDGTAAPVILSIDYRNVLAYSYIYSLLDAAETLYCGGSGSGASRLLAEVYSGATRPTGDSRNEAFVDLSDCTTSDALTTKGTEQLQNYLPVQSLTFDYDPTSTTFVLNRDFKCGDWIVVDFPGIVTMKSRILSVTYTWDRKEGYSAKITVGTEKPDLTSIVKKIQSGTSAIRRK